MTNQIKHMKKTKFNHKKKSASLLVALLIVLLVGTGTTLAYIIVRSDTITNLFLPGEVACAVTEKTEQTDPFKVKNIGNVDAYVRAAVVVTWQDTNGNVFGKQPEYTLTFGSGWTKGSDGFYYWPSALAVGASTTNPVITNYTVSDSVSGDYKLCIEILAEAIQAKPFANADAAWNVTK